MQPPTGKCMHLRVRNAEGGLVTRDCGVVAAYTQQLCWGIRNGRPIDHTVEHVGISRRYWNWITAIIVPQCCCASGL